jgi:phosphoribosylaminoimidazolecarboxamide formyltransferase / IMP cyclohydrolase
MSKIALISVYNKEGIVEFAKELTSLGFEILASGGTAKALTDAGIPVKDVASLVGGGAILGHRVVTLSREVHAGLLAKDNAEDRKELSDLGIPFIDLVCCDLYPLEEEIGKEGSTVDSVTEKTDIGGPTMIRSGAKGGRITICDPSDRTKVIQWLKEGEPEKENFINHLRAKAEIVISRYCLLSSKYHSDGGYRGLLGEKKADCAYGENAYQKPASLYKNLNVKEEPLAIHNWVQVAGSPMSYNNICDVDRMIQTMTHIGAGFEKNFGSVPFISIGAKHGNACGASFSESEIEAIDKMLLGDLRAIFGGSVMVNFPVDEKIAEELIHKYAGEGRRLLDIVAAPSFSPEAIEILSRKKGKCRLLANPGILKAGMSSLDTTSRFRYVRGGFLTQPNYTFVLDLNDGEIKKYLSKHFSDKLSEDIILAWAVGSTSNSNTITLVKEGRLVGNGVGQQDRVGAAKLAIFRAEDAAKFGGAELNLENGVAYSDSFFPFADAPEVLIERGIKTIFSTSGSVNDEKIIELCQNKEVNLLLLPDSLARGFYQH